METINNMESLNKLETTAALSAITAVIDSGPGVYEDHPLATAKKKLEKNLEAFNNGTT